MWKFIVLLLCSATLAITVYGGTIDPSVADEKYVEYGSLFHNVVRLCCLEDKNVLACGSAVVYTDHWIITAAHVVHKCTDCRVIIGDKKYKISKVIVHEDYKDNIFGAHDIALCYVDEPIILDFYPDLYTDPDEVGKVCCVAGWGFSGTFNTGSTFNDGKRRAGSNVIDTTERSVLVCSPSKRNTKSKCTSLEFLISHGDSGGGLFIDGKLAGINSSVLAVDGKPNSTYTDESCHTRISLYHQWIKKYTNHEEKK